MRDRERLEREALFYWETFVLTEASYGTPPCWWSYVRALARMPEIPD